MSPSASVRIPFTIPLRADRDAPRAFGGGIRADAAADPDTCPAAPA